MFGWAECSFKLAAYTHNNNYNNKIKRKENWLGKHIIKGEYIAKYLFIQSVFNFNEEREEKKNHTVLFINMLMTPTWNYLPKEFLLLLSSHTLWLGKRVLKLKINNYMAWISFFNHFICSTKVICEFRWESLYQKAHKIFFCFQSKFCCFAAFFLHIAKILLIFFFFFLQ